MANESRALLLVVAFFSAHLSFPTAQGQVLEKQAILEKFSFWTNKDWDWYQENIPIFESPDPEIGLTYYYRWEMMTGKMVYGSPATGYASTEFTDRPWWSGTYGAISCPAGHQLYEYRWLRDKRFAEDYARYWFRTPGAQPRNYTTWIADAVWQIYKTHLNQDFAVDLKPDLIRNYQGWEKERYVPAEGLFAWDGMHDGMETNINSRQTKQWFDGAPGYRPTLNSYMWADALAIKNIAQLTGDRRTARLFALKADTIKTNLQAKTWDPKRNFFFHRFQKDEEGGIKANTLTYETGKYASSNHGREEIGYIPWYFRLPDPGYESAWQFLMDPNYFFTPYGPTTVEQEDPLFKISPRCCEWSGNAWPFATAQTLKAMANVIKYYDQDYVTKEDFYKQFRIYAITHRKDGLPYIAEANHPVTGSWSGHDVPNHSEHYFHSSFIDQLITGLVGLEPMESDSVEVHPLIPDTWDYFALDDVSYHGRRLSILWDRDGTRYNKGKGLLVLVDGVVKATAPTISRLVVPVESKPLSEVVLPVNHAVNNEKDQYFPRAFSSFSGIGEHSYLKINDGQYWYHVQPANRWTSLQSGNKSEFVGIDFGTIRPISTVKLYLLDDLGTAVKTPESFKLEHWNGKKWVKVPGQKRSSSKPAGSRANTITFKELTTSKLRVVLTPQPGQAVGVSEMEAWGRKDAGPAPAAAPIANRAYKAKVNASYVSRHDRISGVNDGLINPTFRWTAFESPNPADWVEFDFGQEESVNKAYLYFYSDRGGVQPPQGYVVQYWDGSNWQAVPRQANVPEAPEAHLNLASFDEVKTSKMRILLTHKSEKAFSGLYEVELYGSEAKK